MATTTVDGLDDILQRLLPIFSNLGYLFAASRALRWYLDHYAFLFFLIGVFTSTSYHLCLGFAKACFFTAYKHYVIDFWTAELTIPILGLRFIHFRSPFLEKWILWTMVVVIGILVTQTRATFVGQLVIAGGTLFCVAVYVIWHRISHGYWPEYDYTQLTLGTAFVLLGVACFVYQDRWPEGYGYLHSLWHVCGGIAAYFIIGIRPPSGPLIRAEIISLPSPNGPIPMITESRSAWTSITQPIWETTYMEKHKTLDLPQHVRRVVGAAVKSVF